jgi:hypothetical protein
MFYTGGCEYTDIDIYVPILDLPQQRKPNTVSNVAIQSWFLRQ